MQRPTDTIALYARLQKQTQLIQKLQTRLTIAEQQLARLEAQSSTHREYKDRKLTAV